MRKNNGITLISLVITIIVLLILAAVSLNLITGSDGILGKASKATLQSEIASLEERARIIQADLMMNQYWDKTTNSSPSLADIIRELEQENYTIKSIATNGNAVTGISVPDVSIKAGETGIVDVVFEGNSDEIAYYAEIGGKYYQIMLKNKEVTVSRTPSQINDTGNTKELQASITPETIATIDSIEGNKINLRAGNTAGTATLTVTYGSYSATCQITVVIRPTEEATQNPNANVTFSTNYGTIDIIWLDTNNQIIPQPNAPYLYNDSLTPVTWTKNGDTWVEDEKAQSTWYNYVAASEGDAKQSMWANAKNTDGSYFVWIPRYAYRITYYNAQGDTTPTGYYDGDGMWKATDASVKYALDAGIETVEHNGYRYIVHPAFMKDDDKEGLEDYARGGWSEDLSGFWMAKYEMSQQNSKPVSKPNVSSWRGINIGDMYTNSFDYDRDKESHLMKNSEWGAIAYLTHSQFGRNGYEIDINNSSNFMIGNGGGSIGATSVSGIVNAYNTTTGAKASTTGNVYGIYDMSGGAWEYTAVFDEKGKETYIANSSYGLNMTKEAKDEEGNYISTKYITKYTNGMNANDFTNKIFQISKIGDGIKEMRVDSRSWFGDYSFEFSTVLIFSMYGGCCINDSGAGIFCVAGHDGGASTGYEYYGFRTVLGYSV